MREEFLHFVWKHKKFNTTNLRTASGEPFFILSLGQHNHLAGPDFFNAKLEIDGQLWAGNVEIHLKSSDWYVHHHEKDANYNNVIMHVVWEDDIEVFRKDGGAIPCLVLKDLVHPNLVQKHHELMQKKKFINCEKDFSSIDEFVKQNWLERLFVERLEQKSNLIYQLLIESKNDWEKVLFCLLMKNFGLNINGPVFLEIAKAIDFSVFRKVKHDQFKSESLLLGMANLLHEELDERQLTLKKEFLFLSNKFQLKNEFLPKPNFYGLRPNNFPTIRLAQLAKVYSKNEHLFQKIINASRAEEIYSFFEVAASEYWDSHFVFAKSTSKRKKKLSKGFIDLLLINTVIPIQFSYRKHHGKLDDEQLFELASTLKSESNAIINKFGGVGSASKNALQSQSKIQLYNEYCSKNNCLKCAIGNALLLKNG